MKIPKSPQVSILIYGLMFGISINGWYPQLDGSYIYTYIYMYIIMNIYIYIIIYIYHNIYIIIIDIYIYNGQL